MILKPGRGNILWVRVMTSLVVMDVLNCQIESKCPYYDDIPSTMCKCSVFIIIIPTDVAPHHSTTRCCTQHFFLTQKLQFF